MPKSLNPQLIEQLEAQGYCAPLTVISPDEMRGYREQLESAERDHPSVAVRMTQQPHLLFPWMDELARKPVLIDAWRDLMGPDLLLLSTSLRRKEAGAGQYADWHQDAYYMRYEPEWYIGLLAITKQTVANGCLHVIPGSHRWELLPHQDGADEKSVLTRAQRITAQFDASSAVGVELEPGQALFFHPRIVHGSPPNLSPHRRVLCLLEVCPTHTRRVGASGSATALCGVDTHHHFDLLTRPTQTLGVEEQARHRAACESRAAEMYAGSDRVAAGLR